MSRLVSYSHAFTLPAERGQVFDLFADPRSLDRLTPPWFRLLPREPVPSTLGAGQQISYRLRWRGFPLVWESRLTEWNSPGFFAYEQVRGPYRYFRHEHEFVVRGPETEVRDRVHFRSPFGNAFDRLIVKPELHRIFRFRRECAEASVES